MVVRALPAGAVYWLWQDSLSRRAAGWWACPGGAGSAGEGGSVGSGRARCRRHRGSRAIDASCLTWEGQQCQGKTAIVEKLSSLPFQKIQHSITSQDHQPTPDSCILSMVVGQLKADEDPIIGFHQIFILKNINDAWVCTNDMFRLALHNYG
ncbi:nuclear transport factor 2 isoform X1 [Chrysemys picta bellii]|uniref:nuclear transport factor 2 isoform X1 n=1 Tax=Chrysemys picta bellii TaxID=8478 RepID=UPI001C675EF7|nr:nuclear transport factor 2 isoform X1 [Chrysemys picta bellii]